MFRLAAPGHRFLLAAAALAATAAVWLLAPDLGAAGSRHGSLPPSEPRRLAVAQRVTCATTVGDIQIEVHDDWAPIGANRFLRLVKCGFFDGCAIFRAIPNFLAQFGISPDSTKNAAWKAEGEVKDDPLRPDIPMKIGTMAFAGHGDNSRSTHVFFTLSDSTGLGKSSPWEAPFAQVEDAASLATLNRIETKYGDIVDQGKIWQGYEYLRTNFPDLTYINSCKIVGDFSTKCPAPPLAASLSQVLQAAPAIPGKIAKRFGVPVALVLLILVAVVAAIVIFFCMSMMPSKPPQHYGGPQMVGGPGPYGNPQYQMVGR